MINTDQLRNLIINPSLDKIQLYSKNASELLMFTCAVESNCGSFVKQIDGTALGIFQMEPATHYDIWRNYIFQQQSLSMMLVTNLNCITLPDETRLIYDLAYATAMARIHYRRVKEPLPDHNQVDKIWEYYKKYYNTPQGKSTKKKSIEKYKKFVTQTDQAVQLKKVDELRLDLRPENNEDTLSE